MSLRVREPAVLRAVTEMHAAQCTAAPELVPYAVESCRLHLTVMVFSLPDDAAIARAVDILRERCPVVSQRLYAESPCAVRLCGLEDFDERVVFIPVELGADRERLHEYAAGVAQCFVDMPPGSIVPSGFVPHATVYKLSNAQRGTQASLKRLPRRLWESHAATAWGEVSFDALELCAMQGTDILTPARFVCVWCVGAGGLHCR